MRVFLILLIFAIGFGGFSAAAHAFDAQKCHTEATTDAKADGSQHHCPEHMAAKGSTSDSDSDKEAHICLSCDHCCVSHAAFPQFIAALFTPDRNEAYEVFDAVVADNIVAGLKRPPKFLA